MENEDLQRRSRRVHVFWIAAAAIAVIAIGVSMLPDAVDADLASVDRGDVRVEVVDEGRTRMHDVYVISAPVTGRVLRVKGRGQLDHSAVITLLEDLAGVSA